MLVLVTPSQASQGSALILRQRLAKRFRRRSPPAGVLLALSHQEPCPPGCATVGIFVGDSLQDLVRWRSAGIEQGLGLLLLTSIHGYTMRADQLVDGPGRQGKRVCQPWIRDDSLPRLDGLLRLTGGLPH